MRKSTQYIVTKGIFHHLFAMRTTCTLEGVYTPHLWLAQHQTTTYGIIFRNLRKSREFSGLEIFQQKNALIFIFMKMTAERSHPTLRGAKKGRRGTNR